MIMTYEICMKFKCKTCPKQVECEDRQKQYRLMYRPFADLPKILQDKGIKVYGNSPR